MIKASAWRLARIVQMRAIDVIARVAEEPVLERAFPGRVRREYRARAAHLMAKLARLLEKP